jgi:hypothetical protein
MNTTQTQANVKPTHTVVGSRAADLVAFGRSLGWGFPVLGHAPVPTIPIHINGWLIVPAHLDNTPLPAQAQERMNAIQAAGIRPQAWLVIHEAPPLLAPPKVETGESPAKKWFTPTKQRKTKQVLKTTGSAVGVAAIASGALAFIAVAAALVVPIALLAGVVMIDPILVAVSSDGFWVEIDRWDI